MNIGTECNFTATLRNDLYGIKNTLDVRTCTVKGILIGSHFSAYMIHVHAFINDAPIGILKIIMAKLY